MPTAPVTAHVQSNSALFDAIYTALSAYSSWYIYKFGGTSISHMFDMLPAVKLPAAVIAFEGSEYYKHPHRRRAKFHVVVVAQETQDFYTKGLLQVSTLAFKAIELLDQQVFGGTRAVCTVEEDNALDFGATFAAIDVVFEITDH